MESLCEVLKLVDQDKKPTLSILYEAIYRAKLAIGQLLNTRRGIGWYLIIGERCNYTGTCLLPVTNLLLNKHLLLESIIIDYVDHLHHQILVN